MFPQKLFIGNQGRAVRVGSASAKEMLTVYLLIPRALLIHHIINCICFIPNINFCKNFCGPCSARGMAPNPASYCAGLVGLIPKTNWPQNEVLYQTNTNK